MLARKRLRMQDVNDSYFLLLELANQEPVLQECFAILESICLAHGVKGHNASPDFQRYMDLYWMPFFRNALRAMHIYGFIPYHIKRIKSGDKVPEVLPPGTFRWSTVVDRESPDLLNYKISPVPGTKHIETVHVEVWTQINYMVSENSILSATVSSPISYVIESYRNLQDALKRQAHADAWNCTARVAIEYDPKEFNHDTHRKELFTTFGYVEPQPPHKEEAAPIYQENSLNHMPAVYELPKHRHVQHGPMLQPCSDLEFLYNKYKYDVCYLMGVPPELVTVNTRQSSSQNKTQGHNRLFQARCQALCEFLKTFASKVYEQIYGTAMVFDIIPMPRLEIKDLEDLKVLFETGVMQPEHALKLSDILLGSMRKNNACKSSRKADQA